MLAVSLAKGFFLWFYLCKESIAHTFHSLVALCDPGLWAGGAAHRPSFLVKDSVITSRGCPPASIGDGYFTAE